MSEQGLKAKTVALIRQSRQWERNAIAALSPTQRDAEGTLEKWSTKDKLVHVNAWKQVCVENLTDAQAGRTPDVRDDFLAFNDATFELHRYDSWGDVARYSDGCSNALIAAIESYSEAELAQEGLYEWLGRRNIAEFAVSTCVWHGLMHMTEPYIERGDGVAALDMLNEAFPPSLEVLQGERALGTAKYNQACIYAQIGRAEEALALLTEAFAGRPDLKEYSTKDSDLTQLWELPAYQALVA